MSAAALMTSDIERIAILEQQMRAMQDDVHETRKKVEAMHDLMMQAKGAKWAILTLAGVTGFVAGLAHKVFPFLWAAPR
jgi:hypothetical protein